MRAVAKMENNYAFSWKNNLQTSLSLHLVEEIFYEVKMKLNEILPRCWFHSTANRSLRFGRAGSLWAIVVRRKHTGQPELKVCVHIWAESRSGKIDSMKTHFWFVSCQFNLRPCRYSILITSWRGFIRRKVFSCRHRIHQATLCDPFFENLDYLSLLSCDLLTSGHIEGVIGWTAP